MECYWCSEKLIWGADIDVKTNLHCPKCYSEYEILKKRDAFD